MSNNTNITNNIFTVNFKELEERFDPAFYKPEYYKILNSGIDWGKTKCISFSIHHPPEYERQYSDTGYQLIRSQNVRPTGLSLDERPVFFSELFLENKKVVFPEKGNILIVRSGVNAGDVAVVEQNIKHAIIGADNLLLKPDTNKVIPKFIQVFFYTNIGRKLLNRYLTGATNKHISPYYLAKVDFPLIPFDIQKECISIFERSLLQKKQKQAEAEKLLKSIDVYLLGELGITLPENDNSLKNRIFKTPLSKVSGSRFDPNHISKIEFLYNQQWNFKKLPLKDLLKLTPQYGANEQAKDGNRETDIRYIRITDIDGYGNLKDSDWKTTEKVEIKYLLNYNDILFARSGSVGKAYIHKKVDKDAIFAGYLIRFVVDENKISPDYMFYFCNSSIYKYWVDAIQRPAVQANINSEEYKSLKIPLPSLEKQNEIATHIKNIRKKAKQLQIKAIEVLEKAKQEVEEMILNN